MRRVRDRETNRDTKRERDFDIVKLASRETETEIGKGDEVREKERKRERERERATEKLGAKEVEGMVTFSYTFYGITYSPYVALAQQVLY